MKKIIILAIVFIGLFTSSATIEERTTVDILTSYKWCLSEDMLANERNPDDPYILEMYIIFSDTLFTACEVWSDEPYKKDCIVDRYYLESQFDEEEPKFIASKIGKNKNGNYIFEEFEDEDSFGILRIVELTEKKLVIIPMGSIGEKTVWEARPKN